jgi:hypothetical protein
MSTLRAIKRLTFWQKGIIVELDWVKKAMNRLDNRILIEYELVGKPVSYLISCIIKLFV